MLQNFKNIKADVQSQIKQAMAEFSDAFKANQVSQNDRLQMIELK